MLDQKKNKKVTFILNPEIKPKPHSSDSHHPVELKKTKDSNIVVAVRIRPLNIKELETSNIEILRTYSNQVIVSDPVEYNGPEEIFRNRSREHTFTFDFSFDQNSDQVKAILVNR